MTDTTIHLRPEAFPERERTVIESDPFVVSLFRYDTGVRAVRVSNDRGQLVLLPFKGQQIWSVQFQDRVLTMKSKFDQPQPTRDYLSTYGAFLIHCGATAMGVPTAEDDHPLHGELPNAPYQKAHVLIGEDAEGPYVGVGGQYHHRVAFNHNYTAEPLVKLHAGSDLMDISMTVNNLKNTDMELMYLAHINFRPVDHGRLVYSAPCDADHIRVRTSIPSHVTPRPGYLEFLAQMQEHPERHNILSPGLMLDPELVFNIDYRADEDGWAHTMQVHPDGSADYVAHRPSQLDTGVRWMLRAEDAEDALGMVLPATAGPEGYTTEKAKGNIKVVPGHGAWRSDLVIGALSPEDVPDMEQKVERILG
jgi:hypothetical protein